MINIHNIIDNISKLYDKSHKKEDKHFFLFANRKNSKFDTFLEENEDFNNSEKSVCIFFNTAQAVIQSDYISNHKHKWIFFRCLAKNDKYGTFFRDLNVLKDFSFDKFFFLPDIIDPKYRQKNLFIPTIDELISKNIDLKNLTHLTLFEPEELKIVKKMYAQKKTPSTGFWIYLYLRGLNPKAKFTLVGYSSDISTDYHDPSFEKAYILSHINNNLCNAISCFQSS